MWTQGHSARNHLAYQSWEVQEYVNPNQTTQSKSKAAIKQKDKVCCWSYNFLTFDSRVLLNFQMEDGFAPNAKITTLMEGKSATDAKKRNLMKIKMANRIIYLKQKEKCNLIVRLFQIILMLQQVISTHQIFRITKQRE